ncbi:MAG: hypothetical protein AUG49_25570 [Catenulispora sp. 13_1_20CM_3_70_7]|nr:MAG: hypothetical protein AUG49_25570 [Catenulispora sp. 13_1_20CM_3_70_7]
MNGLTDILLSADAGAADLAAAPVPDHYRGAFVRRDEAGMFEGLAFADKDPAQVHRNEHAGKVGVLALTPRPGLGVTDPERRERHEAALRRFRTPPPGTARSPGPDPAPAGRAVETGRAPAARLRTPQERT